MYNFVFKGGSKSGEITNALVYYITKDNQPFSTVENCGFKHFMKVICPLYKVPSRNTMKNKIDEKYKYLANKFKEKLNQTKNFTLTTDIWSDLSMKSYLGVTIHFLEGIQFVSGTIFSTYYYMYI